MFCIATVFAGLYSSYVLSYRFAAVDNTPPAFQARSISWVMAGGLLAAGGRDKLKLLVFPTVAVVVIALLWLAGLGSILQGTQPVFFITGVL